MPWRNESEKKICLCGFGGGLAVSLLAALLTFLYQPKLMNDGQYNMIFMFTFPAGWLVSSYLAALFCFRKIVFSKPITDFIFTGAVMVGAAGPMIMAAVFAPVGLWIEISQWWK